MWPRRPLEIINLAAVGLLLVLAGCCAVKTGHPTQWLSLSARLLAMAAGVLLMARLARREDDRPALRLLVNFYPLLLVPMVFDSLGRIIPAINPNECDAALIAIDRAMLGVDPTVWLERFTRPWLNDLFFLAYCTFYFLPAAVGIPLWLKDRPAARRFIFLIVLAFYLSYIGYFLVPARGPHFSDLDRVQTVGHSQLIASPISGTIYRTLSYLENTKHDAFPSGHTLIAALCMAAAVRHFRLRSTPILVAGTLLIIATVYCRYHYAIDVLAGMALAAALLPLAPWLYRRLGGR
jgi:membrane-associated phospholipid phosphatase